MSPARNSPMINGFSMSDNNCPYEYLKTLVEKGHECVWFVPKFKGCLEREDINSLNGLLRVKGIGDVSLEKSFRFIKDYDKNDKNLFDFTLNV